MTDDRREWYIYVLRDPRDNAVRYVGFTIDVVQRLYSHIYNANAGIESHKYNWIRLLLSIDLQPVMEVIERGTGEWQSVEIYWIRHYRMQGARLTNATDGGEGGLGRKNSPEAIEKTRQALLGRKHSPETIEKMRRANVGKRRTPEQNEKNRQAHLGRKHSPETIEKVRQTSIGRKHSPETLKKMRGRKVSPETIEKTRQANLGRKNSPETLKKMRERKVSPETIEKMRQANLGRKHSPEEVEKRRQANLGGKRSPESRERIRQSMLGRKVSPEHREKLRQANLGLKHSPEAIGNMRQAQTRRHGIAVRRVEDGMIFASIQEAARSIDRCDESIRYALKTGTKYAGYHWERVGETPPADPYTLDGNALIMRID